MQARKGNLFKFLEEFKSIANDLTKIKGIEFKTNIDFNLTE